MNLTMQIETHGVHRTAAEFVEMLTEAGFVDADVRHSTMDKHLVIGHKRKDPRLQRLAQGSSSTRRAVPGRQRDDAHAADGDRHEMHHVVRPHRIGDDIAHHRCPQQ
jgi:hypothetical protein